jgi:putative oxidoreductase
MKNKIFATSDSWSSAALRFFLALVIFPHGAQKLLGWFGGYGFNSSISFLTNSVGLPRFVAFLVIFLEFIGAIALIAGIATRLIAISYIALAIGIVFTSHIQNGFFINWFGNQPGEGYEYFILWIGIAVALVINGAGKYSLDRVLFSVNRK